MGTGAKVFGWWMIFLIITSIMVFTYRGCQTANNMASDAMKTVEDQYKASALLKKYEWFKEASASCDEKLSTLKAYESRLKTLKGEYGKTPRREWTREDREQWNVWESEYLGIKASYNNLASEYNANMSKFNYAFCNVGTLPKGATEPLPREYKPYLTE